GPGGRSLLGECRLHGDQDRPCSAAVGRGLRRLSRHEDARVGAPCGSRCRSLPGAGASAHGPGRVRACGADDRRSHLALAPRSIGGGPLVICLVAGKVIAPLMAGAMTLAWTHSVENIAWEEDWRATPAGLEIVEARVKGSGAG